VRERGADGGVQLRRAELVRRLRSAAEAKAGRKTSRRYGSARLAERLEMGYVVEDQGQKRRMTYQWWSVAQAQELCKGFDSAERLEDTNIHPEELSNESIAKLLRDHNVSLDGFGKGQAKTFDDFAAELRSGKLRLQLDASRHKHIVCVLDVVCVRLCTGSASEKKYLVRSAGGAGFELPSVEKLPHESAALSGRRLLQRLNLEGLPVEFDCSNVESKEDLQQSELYPGIQMVYLKEILSGEASGIMEPAGDGGYAWAAAEEVQNPEILGDEVSNTDFSTLVYPPIGLGEEALLEFLQTNNIDTEGWGGGTARSVFEFAEELVKGEATLQTMPNGQVKRIVDVVVVKLVRQGTEEALVELEEKVEDSRQDLKRLPAVKRRSDEHQFLAARRLITQFLRLNDNYVRLDAEDVRVIEEEMPSVSYPGLTTVYRKRVVRASLERDVFAEEFPPASPGK